MSARCRTGYSFRSAVGLVEDVFKRQRELGWEFAPITDRASTFGFVKWSKLCKKEDVKPVYGVELAVTNSIHAKKPTYDYWTFLAIDSIASINDLISLATSQFRYVPLLRYDQAIEAKGVVKIVGHLSQFEDNDGVPFKFDKNTYIGVGPGVFKGYLDKAIKAKLKPIAVSNNNYIKEEDQAFYQIVCGKGAFTHAYPQHILSDEEWNELRFDPKIKEAALKNRAKVLKMCKAEMHIGALVSPEKPKTLEEMCRDGAKKLNVNLDDEVYSARLARELDMIYKKKFEDYFYIIADICAFARERMIVGPARGSSCGSLVCYLLGITTIDPIPYGLIFERFIDINRADLPDIDIDFSDQKRQLVFDYVAKKYGESHVARLGTVALYRPRSSLTECAAAIDVPPWKINPVLDSIVDRSSGDARALQATEDTLKDTPSGRTLMEEYPEMKIAMRMEGHPRHFSQHAAGIILTDRPINEYIALDKRTRATHCDKKDAEALGLLKIDALGLTQLSIFEDALELAGLPMHHLETVPMDDEAAFDIINNGKYAGIFQFNGQALQMIANDIKTQHVEDIIAMTALARPGPMNSGSTNHWMEVKNGRLPEEYPHPLFEPYLKSTLGVVAYQEQVMEIGRNVGGLSWEDVTDLRKAMSKSLGAEFFDRYGDHFKKGAAEKGIPEPIYNKMWDDLCAYGSWCFNRSHAVAYGIVSYWCCWLKAHYPVAFAAATLSHTDKLETQLKLLRELVEEGIEYVPFDPEFSTEKWSVGFKDGKQVLVGALQNVIGLGPKKVAEIVAARQTGDRLDGISSATQKIMNNARTKLDSIYPITDRVKEICPDLTERNIFTPPTPVIDVQSNGQYGNEVLVIGVFSSIKPGDENEPMKVAKRGHKLQGPTASLNLRITDDSDTIFAKVNRYQFEQIARPIINRGRANKAIYAIKGQVPKDFRMISIEAVRYLGDMDPHYVEPGSVKKEDAVEDAPPPKRKSKRKSKNS